MSSTALGATNKTENGIMFKSNAHEKFYYEKLKRCNIRTSTIWRFVIVLVSAMIQEETLIAYMTLRQAALSQRAYMRVGRQAEVRR